VYTRESSCISRLLLSPGNAIVSKFLHLIRTRRHANTQAIFRITACCYAESSLRTVCRGWRSRSSKEFRENDGRCAASRLSSSSSLLRGIKSRAIDVGRAASILQGERSLPNNLFPVIPGQGYYKQSRAIKVQATSGVAPVIYIGVSRRSRSILSRRRTRSLRIDRNTRPERS